MSNPEDLDLAEQLRILGMDVGDVISNAPSNPPVATVANPEPAVVSQTVVQKAQTVPAQTIPAQTVKAQTVQAQTVPAPQVSTPTVSAPQNVAPAANSDEIVFIDLAKAVNTQKTPWLKLKENERSRILIPNLSKAIPMRVHYLKGIGFFKCLSSYTPEGWISQPAECCRRKDPLTGGLVPRFDENGNEIKAKSRYLLPVIEYPVDKSNHNSLIPGQLPQLKMWNMNAVEWQDLVSAVQGCADNPDDLSTADLSNIDFSLYKDATSKFKTISISVTPKTFKPQFEAQISAELKKLEDAEFFKDALKEARKVISIETILNAYSAQEAVNNAVNAAIENSQMGNQDIDI